MIYSHTWGSLRPRRAWSKKKQFLGQAQDKWFSFQCNQLKISYLKFLRQYLTNSIDYITVNYVCCHSWTMLYLGDQHLQEVQVVLSHQEVPSNLFHLHFIQRDSVLQNNLYRNNCDKSFFSLAAAEEKHHNGCSITTRLHVGSLQLHPISK